MSRRTAHLPQTRAMQLTLEDMVRPTVGIMDIRSLVRVTLKTVVFLLEIGVIGLTTMFSHQGQVR